MAKTSDLLARIRKLCLSYPDVNERESHGTPTFFVRDKRSFLNLIDSYYYVPGERPAIVCAAPDGAQGALIESEPELFFLPKYVARLGWIGMWLDRGTPWIQIESTVALAYETTADKVPAKRVAKKKSAKKAKKR